MLRMDDATDFDRATRHQKINMYAMMMERHAARQGFDLHIHHTTLTDFKAASAMQGNATIDTQEFAPGADKFAQKLQLGETTSLPLNRFTGIITELPGSEADINSDFFSALAAAQANNPDFSPRVAMSSGAAYSIEVPPSLNGQVTPHNSATFSTNDLPGLIPQLAAGYVRETPGTIITGGQVQGQPFGTKAAEHGLGA